MADLDISSVAEVVHVQDAMPLLPAWVDATGLGRDSLGRGTDVASIAAFVASDRGVQRERETQGNALRATFRDPCVVADALYAVVRRKGWSNAAEELARDPGQFGKLLGREGLFASPEAKARRIDAKYALVALCSSVIRIGELEEDVSSRYVGSVQEQQQRDANLVPGLSKATLSALRDIEFALYDTEHTCGAGISFWKLRRQVAVAAAWFGGRADTCVAEQLDQFLSAVELRLGDEGVRAASSAGARERLRRALDLGSEYQAGLDGIHCLIEAAIEGRTHGEAWAKRVEGEAREVERRRALQRERERRGFPQTSDFR